MMVGDTGIFASTSEVQRKVGANVSATSNTEDFINQYMSEAESFINNTIRFNFSDVYSTLNVDVKAILKLAASNLAAIMVINYDTSGMFRSEADRRVNVLFDAANKAIKLIGDKKREDFINKA